MDMVLMKRIITKTAKTILSFFENVAKTDIVASG